MEQDRFDDHLDKQLKAFFKAPEIEGSESFVFKVMEKIERREAFDLAAFFRWLVPTFSFMAAALLLISFWPMAGEEAIANVANPLAVQEAPSGDWMEAL